MMLTAFAYARVSTKDQAVKDNSLPEQLSRIEQYAKENGIEIVSIYRDSDSAYREDNREQFKSMIQDAIQQRPNFVIVDDSSRFARNRAEAAESKRVLRKQGVDIRSVNEPYVDHKTTAGLWLEGIQELKNEATSREIAFHVKKGMERNIQNRDQETGWCYKNGGRAPFGYKIIYLQRGQDHKGKPILKSNWILDEVNAPIIREVIVELYTNLKMSYNQIRDELNSRGISCPTGGYWTTPTVVDVLKEDRLEQYAGIAHWNKIERNQGRKYKSRHEWVTVHNAHPAIITVEELDAARERKKLNRSGAPAGATKESKHLLTGINFEGNPFFTCSCCGGNVIGYGNSTRNWRKYICGVNRMKGEIACSSDWKVDAGWLEQKLVEEIQTRYTTPEKIEELIKDVTTNAKSKNTETDRAIAELSANLRKINQEIQRLLDAIKKGIDPTLIADEINRMKSQKDELEGKIKVLKRSYSQDYNVNVEVLKEFFSNFRMAYDNAINSEKRELIRTFIRHIELHPTTEEIKVEFYHEQVVQSIGLGEPYHK
jgi:site-specific DNA recombinase